MSKVVENNKVVIAGEIEENFEWSHEVYGENFYTSRILVKRTSGVSDFVPIIVSERLIDVREDWKGECVAIEGQFRSCNKSEEEKRRVLLSVFVRDIARLEGVFFTNDSIELDGYICKEPVYRKTPLGREVADLLLAVNRPYGKSDYIPCICWGRNARFAYSLETGTHLKIEGRIQSREYQKRISDTETETRTAYEVSVSKLEIVEDEEQENFE